MRAAGARCPRARGPQQPPRQRTWLSNTHAPAAGRPRAAAVAAAAAGAGAGAARGGDRAPAAVAPPAAAAAAEPRQPRPRPRGGGVPRSGAKQRGGAGASAPRQSLTDAQLLRFERDGWLLTRGCLAAANVEAMRPEIEAVVRDRQLQALRHRCARGGAHPCRRRRASGGRRARCWAVRAARSRRATQCTGRADIHPSPPLPAWQRARAVPRR
jgi:hypothetical protein